MLAIIVVLSFTYPLGSNADNSPPLLTIFAPSEQVAYNTRRIVVFGKVDGTGSPIKEVLVNGKNANLIAENKLSPNIFNFSADLQFDDDGKNKITVSAKDNADNITDKSIEIIIDTVSPKITQTIELSGNQFKITGIADGTGSNIAAILVNSVPLMLSTQNEQVDFTSFISKAPTTIIVTDTAGNKSTTNIPDPSTADVSPPEIELLTPSNGEVFNGDSEITVSLGVTDDIEVKEVSISSIRLSKSQEDIYSTSIKLNVGDNLFSIKAVDTSNNESTINLQVSYFPLGKGQAPQENLPVNKVAITLPPNVEDLNTTLISQFTQITTGGGKPIDIASTSSIEISNPLPIPEGTKAEIEIPNVEGIETVSTPEQPPEIPKGFSFATDVTFSGSVNNTVEISDKEKDNQNTAVLVDSTGRTFVVGFAFFKEVASSNVSRNINKKYKFQTTGGKPLDLITTLTVPGDATEGNAKVSILKGSQSLATIPLKVTPSKEVRVGKRIIAKPQILEPIIAVIKKSGTQLNLEIKGRNFLGKIAVIDSQLQKILNKVKFFTNVTFVPSDGIKIKKFQVVSANKIVLTAKLDKNTKPGIKLFNVITPKGADIGAIVFPDPIIDGKLQATSSPESLILGH